MRVIAGSARGRSLHAPASEKVRPTGDRVKEALFSQIEALAYLRGFERLVDDDGETEHFAAALAWPRVLDLYAGTGALGIEALSRGAERADFVEANRAARCLILDNLRQTGLAERGFVHPLAAEQAVSTLAGSYDLILADPPYADQSAGGVLGLLAASPLVTEGAVLVWEHRVDLRPPGLLGRLRLLRTRRHGGTALSLYSAHPRDGDWVEGADPEQSSG